MRRFHVQAKAQPPKETPSEGTELCQCQKCECQPGFDPAN
jgi:hypothetical protein